MGCSYNQEINTTQTVFLHQFASIYSEQKDFEYSENCAERQQFSYLIDQEWWDAWKTFSGFDETLSVFKRGRGSGKQPGEISCSKIKGNNESYAFRANEPEYLKTPLLPELKEGKHYKSISSKCFQHLIRLYRGEGIKRINIKRYFEPPQPLVYPPLVQCVVLPTSDNLIMQKGMIYPKCLYIGKDQTISSLLFDMEQTIGRKEPNKFTQSQSRFWKVSSAYPTMQSFLNYIESFPELIYDSSRDNSSLEYNCGIKFPGNLIPNSEQDAELYFRDSNLIVVERSNSRDEFIFQFTKSGIKGKCDFCELERELSVKCQCGRGSFCSETCFASGLPEHLRDCTDPSMLFKVIDCKGPARCGIAGIENIGNSCYLSSALQCLANIYELTKYFLEKHFINEINKKNTLGTGGSIVWAYSKLVNELWKGSSRSVSPSSITLFLGIIKQQYIVEQLINNIIKFFNIILKENKYLLNYILMITSFYTIDILIIDIQLFFLTILIFLLIFILLLYISI